MACQLRCTLTVTLLHDSNTAVAVCYSARLQYAQYRPVCLQHNYNIVYPYAAPAL
jgi:hypothetical protein